MRISLLAVCRRHSKCFTYSPPQEKENIINMKIKREKEGRIFSEFIPHVYSNNMEHASTWCLKKQKWGPKYVCGFDLKQWTVYSYWFPCRPSRVHHGLNRMAFGSAPMSLRFYEGPFDPNCFDRTCSKHVLLPSALGWFPLAKLHQMVQK